MAVHNVFDSLKLATFNAVSQTMGYTASWNPGGAGVTVSARVLFSYPSEKETVGERVYDPLKHFMEYKIGDFDQLKESVDQGDNEVVTIKDVEYYVRKVSAKFDGETYMATLIPK